MQNETQNQNGEAGKPRLLDQIRHKCRLLHYSIRTEEAYIGWVVRFLRFHRRADGTWRHPNELTGPEIGRFLTYLATDGQVSASTQNQALCAIVFMYRQVLDIDPGKIESMRAQMAVRLFEPRKNHRNSAQPQPGSVPKIEELAECRSLAGRAVVAKRALH